MSDYKKEKWDHPVNTLSGTVPGSASWEAFLLNGSQFKIRGYRAFSTRVNDPSHHCSAATLAGILLFKLCYDFGLSPKGGTLVVKFMES